MQVRKSSRWWGVASVAINSCTTFSYLKSVVNPVMWNPPVAAVFPLKPEGWWWQRLLLQVGGIYLSKFCFWFLSGMGLHLLRRHIDCTFGVWQLPGSWQLCVKVEESWSMSCCYTIKKSGTKLRLWAGVCHGSGVIRQCSVYAVS